MEVASVAEGTCKYALHLVDCYKYDGYYSKERKGEKFSKEHCQ